MKPIADFVLSHSWALWLVVGVMFAKLLLWGIPFLFLALFLEAWATRYMASTDPEFKAALAAAEASE